MATQKNTKKNSARGAPRETRRSKLLRQISEVLRERSKKALDS